MRLKASSRHQVQMWKAKGGFPTLYSYCPYNMEEEERESDLIENMLKVWEAFSSPPRSDRPLLSDPGFHHLCMYTYSAQSIRFQLALSTYLSQSVLEKETCQIITGRRE